MVLVDTSVWVEFFCKPSRIELTAVVDLDEVVTCLPVLHEVLQGFREEGAFALARDAMLALPIVETPLDQGVFEEAIALYRRARVAGFTVRSSVDCLIAACALRHGLTVLHRDRDFGFLARVSPLRVKEA